MTVNTGLTTSALLPGLMPTGRSLSNSNPLLAAGSPSTGVPVAAQAGASSIGKSSVSARLVSAMKAAVAELRGTGASDAEIRQQILALQAQTPVTLAKQPSLTKSHTAAKSGVKPKGKTFTDGAGNVRQVGTGTIVRAAKPAAGAAAAPTRPAPSMPGSTLPGNATQLPGGTVYSYDQNGSPVMNGLSGLPAATQQQLGMTPTMLQGVNGLVNGVDPMAGPAPTPQMNATNQTALNGLNGFGASGLVGGSAVPVLGAPIVQPVTPAVTTAVPGQPANASGANQRVTNANTNDQASLNQTPAFGYGGYGSSGLPFDGGMASGYSPYGASMTGAYGTTGQKRGFFSRLFG